MENDRRSIDLKELTKKTKKEKEEKKMKNLIKTIVTSLALLLTCTSLTACSSNTAPTATPDINVPAATKASTGDSQLDKIIAKGELVIGTSPDYAPMEFLDAQGNVVGSEMALAQYIADELGVTLKIETMDFSAVLTAVDTGKVDLAMTGLGWKADRAEQYELSIGYNNEDGAESSCQGLIVPSDKVDSYKTMEDFAGLKVAAQASSLQQMYAEAQIPDVQLEVVTSIDVGILSLQTGKVDAVALSCELAKGYENSIEGVSKATPEFVIDDSEQSGNVIAAKKGETELMDKLNEIIKKVNDEGLYIEWDAEAKKTAADMGIEF